MNLVFIFVVWVNPLLDGFSKVRDHHLVFLWLYLVFLEITCAFLKD